MHCGLPKLKFSLYTGKVCWLLIYMILILLNSFRFSVWPSVYRPLLTVTNVLEKNMYFLIIRYKFLYMFIKLKLLISLFKSLISLLNCCCCYWFDLSVIDQLLNFHFDVGLDVWSQIFFQVLNFVITSRM